MSRETSGTPLAGSGRSPGFSLAVILTLALGICGNTAVFSVVDQLLVRPLPYPDADELVMVEESIGGNLHADVSPSNWLDWQRESRTFRRFAAWRSWADRRRRAATRERATGVIGILSPARRRAAAWPHDLR
jgi:hypothetical protein